MNETLIHILYDDPNSDATKLLFGWTARLSCPKSGDPKSWFFCPQRTICPLQNLLFVVRAERQNDVQELMLRLSRTKKLGNCLYQESPYIYTSALPQPSFRPRELPANFAIYQIV